MTSSKIFEIVRHGDLVPCSSAFIDSHTPGSDQKQNFTIIGSGVSENPEQHVHITTTPGFNIGAAMQPPNCRNSMHTHKTAEIFFVFKGTWRFFWGISGNAGDIVLKEGDLFNIPTGMFRGFENIGDQYGTLMAILGADDAGGGVRWAPQVIEEAKSYGLILGDDGNIYDSKKHQFLPKEVKPMPPMTDYEISSMREPSVVEIITNHISRYSDLMALSKTGICKVIGNESLMGADPHVELDFISRDSEKNHFYQTKKYEVLIGMEGYWSLEFDHGIQTTINPGDTCLIYPNSNRKIRPVRSGITTLFRVRQV